MEAAEHYPHQAVMIQEVLTALQPKAGGSYADGTLGAGGHSEAILEASAPDGTLTAFDLDPQAIRIARERLARFGSRVRIIEDSYASLSSHIPASSLDGFLIDLGVSSMQIDDAERGFSFLQDGPLDMRFSPQQKLTAAELVNSWPEEEIARILWLYGEERKSRQIAAAICNRRSARSFERTKDLAETIAEVGGDGRERIHPATRSFQAIRIAVNGELDALEAVLPQAIETLKPGGRLVVISFHSLEDRIVKQFFKRESRDCICPPEQLVCTCGHQAQLRELTRHPLMAGEMEMKKNIRARSAKLRAAEKIGKKG